MISRRTLLESLLASAAVGVTGTKAFGAPPCADLLDPEKRFSFEALTDLAERISQCSFQEPVVDAAAVNLIDYDTFNDIKYRPQEQQIRVGVYPIEMFHQGPTAKKPVQIFTISDKGLPREVRYYPQDFTYTGKDEGRKSNFERSQSPDAGFAGFRVLEAEGEPDWLSFLGCSYFRSPGERRQYGLSARGLAIDLPTPPFPREEFPLFRIFWLEPLTDGWGIVVNALLDSPGITGAYRMAAIRGNGVFMTVQARLFPRRKIEGLAIAPLTSMFWYAKHNHKRGVDWRPEIHDSDGLAIWKGIERIWRPLNNPDCEPPQSDKATVNTSFFNGEQLKGFGLLQRERRFSCYEDGGARYDLRPCAWVEPVGDWPKGNVKLVEISTKIETADNIVAFWAPEKPLEAGEPLEFSYKLHWQLDQPHAPLCANVVATRLGAGGKPGAAPLKDTVKYVVDFKGGKLAQFFKPGDVQAVITAEPSDLGAIVDVLCYPVLDGIWRASFDLKAASQDPIELRLYLRAGAETLSETWAFQHLPSVTSPAVA